MRTRLVGCCAGCGGVGSGWGDVFVGYLLLDVVGRHSVLICTLVAGEGLVNQCARVCWPLMAFDLALDSRILSRLVLVICDSDYAQHRTCIIWTCAWLFARDPMQSVHAQTTQRHVTWCTAASAQVHC